MQKRDTVDIFQKPITGEDYEGRAVLVKQEQANTGETQCGNHLEEWLVVFEEDREGVIVAPAFPRSILVNPKGEPV